MLVIEADTPEELRAELVNFVRALEDREVRTERFATTRIDRARVVARRFAYKNLADDLERLVIEGRRVMDHRAAVLLRGTVAGRALLAAGWRVARCERRRFEDEKVPTYLVTLRGPDGEEVTAGEARLDLAVGHAVDLVRAS
jgi:hypothetical protein